MKVSDWIHVIADVFILVSLALGLWIDKYFLFFTVFVGLKFFHVGFAEFCVLAII